MTDEELKAARELCDGATPGPWQADLDMVSDHVITALVHDGDRYTFSAHLDTDHEVWAETEGQWTDVDSKNRDEKWRLAREGQELRDATFIAAARTLVPQLLDEIERLRNPPLTEAQVIAALHEGAAERAAAEGDNAWTSLLHQRQELTEQVAKLSNENDTLHQALQLMARKCGELDRARADAASSTTSWEDIAIHQHDLLESYTTWPPTNPQACGWCLRAAGDTQEARESATKYTYAEIREHTISCPHNPVVQQRDEALEMLAIATDQRDAARAELSESAQNLREADRAVVNTWAGAEQATAEKIAAYIDQFGATKCGDCGELAAEVRSGAWRKP